MFIVLFAWLYCSNLAALVEGLANPIPSLTELGAANLTPPSTPSDSVLGTNTTSDAINHYVVYPKEPGDFAMASAINASIYRLLRGEGIEIIASPLTGIEFWIVSAKGPQLSALSKIPNVSGIRD